MLWLETMYLIKLLYNLQICLLLNILKFYISLFSIIKIKITKKY